MELFTEGKIKFFAENKQTRDSKVFFNPMRDFDRDLNVIFINALGKHELRGIDLFGGSGVRGLRLASETNAFNLMRINDLKTSAIISKNVKLNTSKLKSKIDVTSFDATDIYSSKEGYDYLDIDPFGSPVRYLLQAMPKVRYGGVMALTATDGAALYGKATRAGTLKYGAKSFKTSYFNEVGLRILIKRTEEIANMYDRSVTPLFFDVRRHYLRVYFRAGKADARRKLGYIYQCTSCPNRSLMHSDHCEFCGEKNIEIGPLWLGRLFERDLVKTMYNLAQDERVKRYLQTMKGESDAVSYYTTAELASYLKSKEKSVDAYGTKTVLNDKGFRSEREFKDMLEEYRKLE
jgi:tRNA (guanine26-N2/guanine27-N2)-dimethyltransferase